MRKTYVLGIVAVVWLVTPPTMLLAQRLSRPGGSRGYGGYGGYGDYGDYSADAGVMGLFTSSMNQASVSRAVQSDRLAGQNAAMQQRSMVQSEVRNTLSTQANSRTQDILSQQQSNRDWWFQVQQQQTARRQTYEYGSPALVSAGFSAEPVTGGFAVASPLPEVSMDIIKWPCALQEQMFASRRALIEAPYRRSPPALSAPTANDYRDMVKTVDEMKAMLEWRLSVNSGLETSDYEQAKAFLDQLSQEASERSVNAVKSPKPE
jgi:hypothetical protein